MGCVLLYFLILLGLSWILCFKGKDLERGTVCSPKQLYYLESQVLTSHQLVRCKKLQFGYVIHYIADYKWNELQWNKHIVLLVYRMFSIKSIISAFQVSDANYKWFYPYFFVHDFINRCSCILSILVHGFWALSEELFSVMQLLWIILLASCAALVIQSLAANLGVVTGMST